MKRLFQLFVVIIISHGAWCQAKQQGQIRGHILDKDTQTPLESASVSLLNAKDSFIAKSTFTDKDGVFFIEGVSEGAYQLYITYLGYKALLHTVVITGDKKNINPEDIFLERTGVTLGLVEIVDIKPPIVIKKDSMEFNTSYYKTRPNAVLEELLKKLPGIEIDRDGTIKINGETVQRLLVDGRPFFGDDPKLATRMLPADIIDKIQLIDRKSDQAQFTGIDDGKREKTINITIKKNRKKGYFGRGTAGYGTDRRFVANGNINQFQDARQISLLVNGENVNGYQDGGARIGGNGITRSWNGGANYSTAINKNLKISGSYYVNNSHTENHVNSVRQNLLPDTSFYYNLDNSGIDNSSNQVFNFRLESRPDTSIFFTIGTNFNYTRNSNLQENIYESLNGHRQLINNGATKLTNTSEAPNFSTTAFLGKRFRKAGRTISSNINIRFSTNNQQGSNLANTLFVQPNGERDTDTINQRNDISARQQMLSVNLIYTEPVSTDRFLEFTYTITRNHNKSDKYAYDFNTPKGTYDLLNDSLSNSFENTGILQSGAVSLRTQKTKYDYILGLNLQNSYLNNNDISQYSRLRQRTLNYSPFVVFNYALARNKNFRLNYTGNTEQPRVTQLQPVPDNSNPLYIQLGNPDLKPAFTHNTNLEYNTFNPVTRHGFSANVGSELVMNKIVNVNWFDSLGRQFSQPQNVNGSYNVKANISNSFPIKNLQTAINTNTAIAINRDISYINGIKGATQNLTIRQGFNFNYSYRELFDLSATGSVNYTTVQYSVQPGNNTHYFNYTFFLNGNLNLPLGFILGGNLDYLQNTGRSAGYNQAAIMLNAYISKNLFNHKQGLIKIQGFDLLKRNLSISRIVGENYIEDVQTQVLQRFFLLSFTYFLKPGGGGN